MFNIKIHKIESSAHENDGTFLQTPFWCEFKARHGWTYRRFEIEYTLPPLNADEGCEKSKKTLKHRERPSEAGQKQSSGLFLASLQATELRRGKCDGILRQDDGTPVQGDNVRAELAVLNRSFAKGMFSIAYIPLFPKLPY
ncbi:MAG: hypothetical protein SPK18_02230, partial [Treponema sp.]|nr:hypothetical protein [Treponema sp.]MDY5757388.1 hypothetical protein [Treponema sp.]